MSTHTDPDPEIQELVRVVQHIRDLTKHIQEVQAHHDQLMTQVQALNKQIHDLTTLRRQQQRLLEHCLNTGEDPTVVQLTKNDSDLLTRTILMENTSGASAISLHTPNSITINTQSIQDLYRTYGNANNMGNSAQ
jgi:phage shock protein A